MDPAIVKRLRGFIAVCSLVRALLSPAQQRPHFVGPGVQPIRDKECVKGCVWCVLGAR